MVYSARPAPRPIEMHNCHLEVASLTNVGRVRPTNEDQVSADGSLGFAFVADGMGGHRGGELAARLAQQVVVSHLQRRLSNPGHKKPSADFVRRLVADADRAIFDAARKDPNVRGMGTTLALALFHHDRAILAHVGDCRIYRLRDGRLEALTRDDSLLRDEVELGLINAANAADSHNRHLVTRALGMGKGITPHVREEETRCGDVFLLCSDGLNDMVDDGDIELILDSLKSNLPLAVTHLVQLANDNGGQDNVSAVLVRLDPPPPSGRLAAWLARLFGR